MDITDPPSADVIGGILNLSNFVINHADENCVHSDVLNVEKDATTLSEHVADETNRVVKKKCRGTR